MRNFNFNISLYYILIMRILIFLCFLAIGSRANAADKIPAEKILEIKLIQTGQIIAAGDTVAADKLATYIRDRLFKSWLDGKIYSKIRFSSYSGISELVSGPVLKEIREGQKLGLNAICLEKYRDVFDNLEAKKQDQLKKKCPVLFQTEF